jgi:hypothetical protein
MARFAAARAEHTVLVRDAFAYSSHPHAVQRASGEWVLVLNQSIRRVHRCHPPSDPLFRNYIIRSSDQGTTWSTPRVAPGYDWQGVECAGLTALEDGGVLLNQWRFAWYPLETGLARADRAHLKLPDQLPSFPKGANFEVMPWVRGDDGTYVHRSDDGGRTWSSTVRVETRPFSGGYNMRGALQLPDGELLLPLSDIPNYRVIFVVRSRDGGRTWSAPKLAAELPGRLFEEPSLIKCADGRLLMLLRENTTERLFQIHSADNGNTWSTPRETGILGCPPHLLALPDGRLLCTFGYRFEPFSIRAVVSEDCGATWSLDTPLIVRAGLPNDDIGYPTSLLRDDGRVCTVYYADDADGVTSIMMTTFELRSL